MNCKEHKVAVSENRAMFSLICFLFLQLPIIDTNADPTLGRAYRHAHS